jgi:hypothetical protein
MKLIADLMVFIGAILLTAGTDLVVETAGQNLSNVGGLLGVLVSVVGVSLLTAGILSHRGLGQRAREQEREADTARVGGAGGKRS